MANLTSSQLIQAAEAVEQLDALYGFKTTMDWNADELRFEAGKLKATEQTG